MWNMSASALGRLALHGVRMRALCMYVQFYVHVKYRNVAALRLSLPYPMHMEVWTRARTVHRDTQARCANNSRRFVYDICESAYRQAGRQADIYTHSHKHAQVHTHIRTLRCDAPITANLYMELHCGPRDAARANARVRRTSYMPESEIAGAETFLEAYRQIDEPDGVCVLFCFWACMYMWIVCSAVASLGRTDKIDGPDSICISWFNNHAYVIYMYI
jgi:hypothetical protein